MFRPSFKTTSRRIWPLVTVILLSGLNSLSAQEKLPFQYSAEYHVFRDDSHVGSLHVELAPLGGIWRLHSKTEPKGIYALFAGTEIEEISYLDIENKQLRSLAYLYEDGRRTTERDISSYFDWSKNTVFSQYDDKPITASLKPSTFDRHAVILAIMSALRNKQEVLIFPTIDKGEMQAMEFERLGEETLELPYGKLKTIKLKEIRAPGKRHIISWHAPTLNYLMVKMEQHRKGKLVARLDLKKFSP